MHHTEFYADLLDCESKIVRKDKPENLNSDKDEPDNFNSDKEKPENEHSIDTQWKKTIECFRNSLSEVMEDLTGRLMEGDHNLIAGASKFINSYKKMVKSQAPNSSISYALHNFGKSDRKFTL